MSVGHSPKMKYPLQENIPAKNQIDSEELPWKLPLKAQQLFSPPQRNFQKLHPWKLLLRSIQPKKLSEKKLPPSKAQKFPKKVDC